MTKSLLRCTTLFALLVISSESGWSTSKLFMPIHTYNSGGRGTSSIAVADVNADGNPDLIVANFCSQACEGTIPEGDVGVLLGKGNGTFESPQNYGSGGYDATSIAVADVNRDGNLDLWCLMRARLLTFATKGPLECCWDWAMVLSDQ